MTSLPTSFLLLDARDEQARAERHDQGRELADQAVADRELRERAGRLPDRPAELHHADEQPAEHVDGRDDDARDGVAADELAGTVHRPVKVGLARHVLAALPGLLLVDRAGVQVGVDRHLLARHRVEGEPRRDLADPRAALGDDDELDDEDDQEDHDAHRQVAGRHELAERLHHLARGAHRGLGRRRAVAGGQDQSRRGDVQDEPEDRDRQQQRRQDGELERAFDVDRRHENHHGDREIQDQQQVEQVRRQRDEEDQQHPHHRGGEEQAAVLVEPGEDGVLGEGGHPCPVACLRLRGGFEAGRPSVAPFRGRTLPRVRARPTDASRQGVGRP